MCFCLLVGCLLACNQHVIRVLFVLLYWPKHPHPPPPANELILNAQARHVNKLPFGHATVIDIQSHCGVNCMKYTVETNKMVARALIYLRA
jgi:hypothetical protein